MSVMPMKLDRSSPSLAPHLLAALSKINTELKQVIDRMERRQTPSDSSDAEGTPGTAEEQATGDA